MMIGVYLLVSKLSPGARHGGGQADQA